MHYYKRNIGDYAKKAGRLSMLEHGAYVLLMDAIYDREKFPTKAEAIDWTWASTTQEVEATEFVLSRFFTLEDGVYVQKRILEVLDHYHSLSATNKRIAQDRERTVKKNARSVDASLPNHEPLTTNHEKDTTKPKPAASPPVPYLKIIDLYHTHCPKLPRVVKVTDKRKRAIGARWKDDADNLEYWEAYFKHAAKSKFLHGNNDRGWKADIDFLITERAMVGMQEGKYHHG